MTSAARKLRRKNQKKKQKIITNKLKSTLDFKNCNVCEREYDIDKKEFDDWFVKFENQELLLFCKNCWDN